MAEQGRVDQIRDRWAVVQRLGEPRNPDMTSFSLEEACADVTDLLVMLRRANEETEQQRKLVLAAKNNIASLEGELLSVIRKWEVVS